MVSLAYRSTAPLTGGFCGNYGWIIRWALQGSDAASANGYVVQKIHFRFSYTKCPAEVCPPQVFPNLPLEGSATYWEAWSVKNGQVRGSDTFGVTNELDDYFGNTQVEGWAKFIPGYEEPNSWGTTRFAGSLPSTTDKPAGWSNSNSLYRRVTTSFNCCGGRQRTQIQSEVKNET